MVLEYIYIFFYLIPCLFVFKSVSITSSTNKIFWNLYLLIIFIYIGARFQIGGDIRQFFRSPIGIVRPIWNQHNTG